MLMFEMHYYKNGKHCMKYIYSYSRREAEAQARAYKTFFKLEFIGYR